MLADQLFNASHAHDRQGFMEWTGEIELRLNHDSASFVEKAEFVIDGESRQAFCEIIGAIIEYERSDQDISLLIDVGPALIVHNGCDTFPGKLLSHFEPWLDDDLARSVLVAPPVSLLERGQVLLGADRQDGHSEEAHDCQKLEALSWAHAPLLSHVGHSDYSRIPENTASNRATRQV